MSNSLDIQSNAYLLMSLLSYLAIGDLEYQVKMKLYNVSEFGLEELLKYFRKVALQTNLV